MRETAIRNWLAAFAVALAAVSGARAQDAASYAFDIPPWFASTFLDFREDIGDAARDGRRLLVYFGQDDCPYCKQLMVTNFSQRAIVDKTRKNFVAVALNLWGDREVTWIDGRVMTEKEFARMLNVQFTPTLLFFDEKGLVVARLNGYYPPQRFEAVLDYVAGRLERNQPLAEYLVRGAREPASPRLHDEPFFLRPPYDLRRKPGNKPLAVIFETTDCSACDELHRDGFRRDEVLAQVKRVDMARFALGAPTELTTPAGRKTSAEAWARELNVTYAPTVIFFDESGSEVFRIEAYLRPFHFASSFAYVTSGAYRAEPSFQRYLQGRAGEMRARGERVELWK
ncbi:MAG: thioredoxin fold domain-containing protein [Pseudomonadota bacterium]|nr:thioredoxin fold domain-containing protein [Pseudomonadota bacterium]